MLQVEQRERLFMAAVARGVPDLSWDDDVESFNEQLNAPPKQLSSEQRKLRALGVL